MYFFIIETGDDDDELASCHADEILARFCEDSTENKIAKLFVFSPNKANDKVWNIKDFTYSFHSGRVKSKIDFLQFCDKIQWKHSSLKKFKAHLLQQEHEKELANQSYCERVRSEFADLALRWSQRN